MEWVLSESEYFLKNLKSLRSEVFVNVKYFYNRSRLFTIITVVIYSYIMCNKLIVRFSVPH